ncbi:hypothetical protein [uncultured Microbacterium sp.]|uniref:hypothetical protein n=1 Tax=uncultured Microbacterium sp. TaxID=191216 RepID=UPI0028DC1B6B|nr:hypothetical protein [uncultured Microbacterium sp.]
MSYIYVDKVGAGPAHPDKKWGLFSDELTVAEAEERYNRNAALREDWFGIVHIEPGEDRPSAYLQMCPRANGVVLHKLTEHGSIAASYTWGAYYSVSEDEAYEGDDDRVFLGSIYWYVYPEGAKFFRRTAITGSIGMTFTPQGYAKEDRVTKNGFGEPDTVETREFRDVDVSANWFEIPEFGDWDDFFHPDRERGSKSGN